MTRAPGFGRLEPGRPTPIAARPETREVHGVPITDEYAWIRAENWRDVLADPSRLPKEIRDLLERENRHTASVMKPTLGLQKRLVAEMRGRMEDDEAEVPVPDGPFEYYSRYREGGQQDLVCRRPRGGGPEQILLDGDAMAEDLDFFEIGGAEPSSDHGLLAWSADDKGSELYTLKIRDLSTGIDRDDLVVRTDGAIVWTADDSAVFYVRLDEDHRARSVWLHVLGSDPGDDRLVYAESDPAWYVSVGQSLSRRFVVISIEGHDASEVRVLDRSTPLAEPQLLAARTPGLHYEVDHRADAFLILTNAGGAVDFRIVEAPVDSPHPETWRDVVPHRPGRLIVGMQAFAHHLVRLEREDALPRIVIRDFADGQERAIDFPEEAYTLGLEDLAEQDAGVMRFSYSSMTTPTEIYDYDMRTGERVLRKRQVVPSGHDPALYVTRRIFAPSSGGVTVPVSILHRRDLALDGSAPLLLYGYGAYGTSMPASFSTKRLSLVDRGFVFAIAHVRGGTEKGWGWYTDGKLGNKPNSFADFVAAAHALVSEGFTSPGRIVAQGGSAGGLLMGAVANIAPDLFAGVVGDVPFVDVLNTILDAELPLTPPEWLEWGNPILDREAFETIRSYSPYDNVRPQAYPAILALGGLTDPRVTYWEPAKWVARLRTLAQQPSLVLLRTNMEAGHGGASGRYDRLDEVALTQAFALAVTGCDLDGKARA